MTRYCLAIICVLFGIVTPVSPQQTEWKDDPSPHAMRVVTVEDGVQLEVLSRGQAVQPRAD